MARDSQRSKVYRWEREAITDFYLPKITLEACTEFVVKVCKDIEFTPPRVTDGRGRKGACAFSNRICLPAYSRTRPIVLHELAHIIAKQTFGREIAGHGSEFVRCYMWLLQKYCKQPLRHLQVTATKSRVKYGPAQLVEVIQAKPLIRYVRETVGSLPLKKLQKIQEIIEDKV